MSTESVEVADPFLTREEVADRLRVSQRTVDRYIDAGTLPASKVGRLVRIRLSDFERFAAPGDSDISAGSARGVAGSPVSGVAPAVDHPPVDGGGPSSVSAA